MSGFKVGVVLFVFVTSVALLTACTDADMVSSNLSQDADNFEINRRIVFFQRHYRYLPAVDRGILFNQG